MISSQGDGTLERILTPRLGEFLAMFLTGELGFFKPGQMSNESAMRWYIKL